MLLFFEFYWLGCVGFLIGLMLSPNFSFDRFSFFDALRALIWPYYCVVVVRQFLQDSKKG